MQFKATMSYHFIYIRMAIIKTDKQNQKTASVSKSGVKIRTIVHCQKEHKMVQLLQKIICQFLKSLTESPNNPEISSLGI